MYCFILALVYIHVCLRDEYSKYTFVSRLDFEAIIDKHVVCNNGKVLKISNRTDIVSALCTHFTLLFVFLQVISSNER